MQFPFFLHLDFLANFSCTKNFKNNNFEAKTSKFQTIYICGQIKTKNLKLIFFYFFVEEKFAKKSR